MDVYCNREVYFFLIYELKPQITRIDTDQFEKNCEFFAKNKNKLLFSQTFSFFTSCQIVVNLHLTMFCGIKTKGLTIRDRKWSLWHHTCLPYVGSL